MSVRTVRQRKFNTQAVCDILDLVNSERTTIFSAKNCEMELYTSDDGEGDLKDEVFLYTGAEIQRSRVDSHDSRGDALRRNLDLCALKSSIPFRKDKGLRYSRIFDWMEGKL